MSTLVVLFLLFVGYLFPSLVAHVRGHRNENAIFLLNFLLGWTAVGWCAALVWSATDNVGN